LLLISPITAGYGDVLFAEDFAGVAVDDGDSGFVDQGKDVFSALVGAGAEVVPVSGSSQADLRVVADVVVSEPVAPFRGVCPFSRQSQPSR